MRDRWRVKEYNARENNNEEKNVNEKARRDNTKSIEIKDYTKEKK